MNCSKCGSAVAPDAGFCRNCGAIFRGKAATATLIPAAPAQGPPPPVAGPEPKQPVLADAGYWAPPEAHVPGAPSLEQGYAQPSAPNRYPTHVGGGLPPGAQTVASWGPAANGLGAMLTISDVRATRRLQAIDLAACFGAVAAGGSLFIAWYQISFNISGVSASISTTALGRLAGGWRWSILLISIAVLVELLVAVVVSRSSRTVEWPHRSILAVLCAANLAAVVAAMIASPFNNGASYGLMAASLGPGAYVGFIGALVAMIAAALRLFTGPPALAR